MRPRNGAVGIDQNQRHAALQQKAAEIAGKADELRHVAAIDQPIARQHALDAVPLENEGIALTGVAEHETQAAEFGALP